MPELTEEIDDFLSPNLDLRVAGKVYSIPSPPARVGLRLQAAFAVAAARHNGTDPKPAHARAVADDEWATTLEQDALGPVYAEMMADDVPLPAIQHAGMTAYMWIVAGEAAARAYWISPVGKALTPRQTTTSPRTGAES
ncbi:hypothetical protein RDI86_02275 [Cellulosimicrobium sp. XJ-DQ-B-000]|uniref:DUF7426 family protein n=1 Tax=Cellulosimicrobium sp. XJ-DQ-B-000 TaxID=3072182 RepID=UPI002807A47A|nr:hypothetical protein [Cellulosimicrobium sp. XJ-DQ-B-000]MDQ8040668.1 hypothetical protein [Cellulosimicrobium sp. XJ-DQ-B-000]